MEIADRSGDVPPGLGPADSAPLSGHLHQDTLGRPKRLAHPSVGLRPGQADDRSGPDPGGGPGPPAIPSVRTDRAGRPMGELADRRRDRAHGPDAMAGVVMIEPGEPGVDRAEPGDDGPLVPLRPAEGPMGRPVPRALAVAIGPKMARRGPEPVGISPWLWRRRASDRRPGPGDAPDLRRLGFRSRHLMTLRNRARPGRIRAGRLGMGTSRGLGLWACLRSSGRRVPRRPSPPGSYRSPGRRPRRDLEDDQPSRDPVNPGPMQSRPHVRSPVSPVPPAGRPDPAGAGPGPGTRGHLDGNSTALGSESFADAQGNREASAPRGDPPTSAASTPRWTAAIKTSSA